MDSPSQNGRAARKCTVLVVDDDQETRAKIETMLQSLGYRALVVPDGLSAISRLAHWHPDIILTDIYMPEFDGIELINALRTRGSAIPIVAMTGDSFCGFDVLSAAMGLGAAGVLHKPFSPTDLSLVLGTALAATH